MLPMFSNQRIGGGFLPAAEGRFGRFGIPAGANQNRNFLIRKCLVVTVVLIVTCFNLYFKVQKSNLNLTNNINDNKNYLKNGDNPAILLESSKPHPEHKSNHWLFGDRLFEKSQKKDSNNNEIILDDPGNYVINDHSDTLQNDEDILDRLSDFNFVPNSKLDNNLPKTLNNFVDQRNVYRIRSLKQLKSSSSSKSTKSTKENKKNSTKTIELEQKLENSTNTKIAGKGHIIIPLIEDKNDTCTSPAYLEFPPDIFGHHIRSKGAILFHIAIILYMFYCLAVVCDHYFLPSLEECCQRLNLSQDVAGATFMAAGSSAPELFTAILGVFIAKGDVGTGTIVGSAVFNILFVIGLCSIYTVSTELNWWPVARDSSYYTFTVLILIVCIYDGEVTTFESFILLFFYGVYILIMNNNIRLRDYVQQIWQTHFQQTKPADELNNLKSNTVQAVHYHSFKENDLDDQYGQPPPENNTIAETRNPFVVRMPEVTVFEAANQVIIMHKRLFRPITRFRSAAYLVIIRARKAKQMKDNFYSGINTGLSMDSTRKMSKIGPDENYWKRVPDLNTDGWQECVKWGLVAPLHATLFYTIPNCKEKSHLFLVTFFASITWTAIFSYVMVWMVTLIGYTFGIPDSIMGITFLAAGTSVPDAYASLHVAKLGRADMAVSNSIGSNVFDILIGLALPWFVETAIVDPGSVSSINSRGLIYAVVLLFLSLLITIFLFHRHRWTLNPSLGYSLLATYAAFVVISSLLEFNFFGYVNPPMCGE